MSDGDDGFLARWSRRKARVQSGLAEPAEAPVAKPVPGTVAPAAPAGARTEAQPVAMPEAPGAGSAAGAAPSAEPEPPPTMDDVAALRLDSDYSRFVGAEVDRGVSNAAMKKLFSDPHFNVMDGLDTYIDDYGKPDPIPPSMLRKMTQSALLGLFDDEADTAKPPAAPATTAPSTVASPESGASAEVAQSHPGSPPDAASVPDDDPDLRLQQDDDARRRGAAPEPGS